MTDSQSIWLALILAGAGTFLLRLSFLQFLAKRDIPSIVRRALVYVPPAVLSALVLPAAFSLSPADQSLSLDPIRLALLGLCALIAHLTRNITLTLVAGLGLLMLAEAML